VNHAPLQSGKSRLTLLAPTHTLYMSDQVIRKVASWQPLASAYHLAFAQLVHGQNASVLAGTSPANSMRIQWNIDLHSEDVAQWAAADPRISGLGWSNCSPSSRQEAIEALMRKNPAFCRRLVSMYLAELTPGHRGTSPSHRSASD
jgi:hypothetical protein